MSKSMSQIKVMLSKLIMRIQMLMDY